VRGKKREEKEKMVKEEGVARTKRNVWELVNKERKRRKRINEDINMEEWKEYFMKQLGEAGERVIKGREKEGRKKSEKKGK